MDQKFDMKLEFGWTTSMMGLALIDQVTHLIPICEEYQFDEMNLAKNSDGCSGEMVFQPLTLVSSAKQKEIIFLLFMSNFTSSKQIFSLVFIFFNHFPYHIPNNCLFLCVEKRRMNDRERNVASNFLVFALNKEGVAFKTGCS